MLDGVRMEPQAYKSVYSLDYRVQSTAHCTCKN